MADLFDLEGRRIAVVGGAGDIGSVLVRLLCELGADVCIVDRDKAALERVTKSLPTGARVTFRLADVTDEAAMAAAFAGFDGLDGLVNGAAVENVPTPIDQFDLADFRRVLDVNVAGVMLGLKHGLPLLAKRGGSVVNFASTAGIKGAAMMSAYVASKHAVVGLTRSAAVEWGPQGVRVNAICPGPVEGRMIDAIFGSAPGAPSDMAKARMAQIPSRRFARPEEVARVTAFLLSPASEYVNGSLYSVDGGICAI
ncbi:MAG: SDR family oxidoreductase [Novosphingobium sp.]|nr:SDR family oxidoreductase [Novosphingobium sp.]